MKLKRLERVLKLAILSLLVFGAMTACTPLVKSEEGYKQAALNECAKQPTHTDYNNCVNRAKMEAEEFDIDEDRKLKPQ